MNLSLPSWLHMSQLPLPALLNRHNRLKRKHRKRVLRGTDKFARHAVRQGARVLEWLARIQARAAVRERQIIEA